MSRVSIRWRLLAGVAAVQVLAALLATVLVVRHERARSYAVLDAELVEHATMVTSVIEAPDSPAEHAILHRELLTLPKDDVYVLSDASGRVISASGTLSTAAEQPSMNFVDLSVDGRRYRVLTKQDITVFNDDPQEMAKQPKLTLVYGAPVAGVEEHIQRVAWAAAGLGLAILALSLIAAGWVVRAGLRPVMQLAGRATKIDSTHWEWQSMVEDREADELRPLSMALTRLVERLRQAFVRERQFSADAAHEMKTAVAIVKSTLELALERDGGAAEYRAEIERALDDMGRMQGLVSGMLQLAKIEGLGGRPPGEVGAADAVEEIRSAVRRLGPLLEARQIRVDIKVALTAMRAGISPEALALVLTNLLENAIHYSPDGGWIAVRAEERAEKCAISIEDAGCGVDAEALPHIFERFYRGDRSRSRESGGAGLGLAIVQAIVHQAGGTVTVLSTPGVGSMFTVILPRA